MKIAREEYLSKLVAARGDGFVKVITGVRRCGNSYLLFTLFKEYLTDPVIGYADSPMNGESAY